MARRDVPKTFYGDITTCCMTHTHTHWGVFAIPRTVLKESLVKHQTSPLLKLPNEILLRIFAYASWDEKLFFALTCKTLLDVTTMTTVVIPSALSHRVHHLSGCPGMLSLLHLLGPRGPHGHPKETQGLCCDCYRYRPRRISYWKCILKHLLTEGACLTPEGYESAVTHWNTGYSYQCPECYCVERVWGQIRLRKQG
ncbi:hypothetical protein F4677DRAFT_414300 [Hypoxylon crocopeplum]|nr:hypothetical protein F4677DRAFT_414300 [Hypoxylon crocopeplum]